MSCNGGFTCGIGKLIDAVPKDRHCHARLPQTKQDSIEHELTQIRAEEKRLIGLLSEKGAGPQVSEGTLAAMLKLEDRQRTKR
eukprot:1152680-Pelagomonas_calceolata.AAC.3